MYFSEIKVESNISSVLTIENNKDFHGRHLSNCSKRFAIYKNLYTKDNYTELELIHN